jgi:hypothetical protein
VQIDIVDDYEEDDLLNIPFANQHLNLSSPTPDQHLQDSPPRDMIYLIYM